MTTFGAFPPPLNHLLILTRALCRQRVRAVACFGGSLLSVDLTPSILIVMQRGGCDGDRAHAITAVWKVAYFLLSFRHARDGGAVFWSPALVESQLSAPCNTAAPHAPNDARPCFLLSPRIGFYLLSSRLCLRIGYETASIDKALLLSLPGAMSPLERMPVCPPITTIRRHRWLSPGCFCALGSTTAAAHRRRRALIVFRSIPRSYLIRTQSSLKELCILVYECAHCIHCFPSSFG